MVDETEEREVKDELEAAPIDAPAPPEKLEVKEDVESPKEAKESKPQLVLHKFEKAVEKEYTFSGQDLALFAAGVLCLAVAAYFYGRASVEVAGE
jgi:hypothetical protein